MRTDVLIVGGGPAGLAAAIAARLAGFETTVADRREPPIDKACGEGLMPDGLDQLRRLGVRLDGTRLHPFYGIRYLDGVYVAEGRFPSVSGAGVRRTHLHEALVRRATELDVRLLWGTRVDAPWIDGPGARTWRGVETSAGRLEARWILGADGLRSRVRDWLGQTGRPARRRRFGVRRHFAVTPWSDLVEVYWADHSEAYVTPVGTHEVGVALLWSEPEAGKGGFDALMTRFPALRKRLDGVRVSSRDRGCGPLRQRVRRAAHGNVALVGDASGYVDAITGEGLSLAFHQVPAVIEAIRRGDLTHYARQHRRIGFWANGLTNLLLRVEARPWLRRRMVRALGRDPELFARILAVHCRARPVRSLGVSSAARLVWGLRRRPVID